VAIGGRWLRRVGVIWISVSPSNFFQIFLVPRVFNSSCPSLLACFSVFQRCQCVNHRHTVTHQLAFWFNVLPCSVSHIAFTPLIPLRPDLCPSPHLPLRSIRHSTHIPGSITVVSVVFSIIPSHRLPSSVGRMHQPQTSPISCHALGGLFFGQIPALSQLICLSFIHQIVQPSRSPSPAGWRSPKGLWP
jgi:hypothetical protein